MVFQKLSRKTEIKIFTRIEITIPVIECCQYTQRMQISFPMYAVFYNFLRTRSTGAALHASLNINFSGIVLQLFFLCEVMLMNLITKFKP